MEAKDYKFEGFAKLYNGSGTLVCNVIVMRGCGDYCGVFIYSIRNGKLVYSAYAGWDSKEKPTDLGFSYRVKFQDDMGQQYYVTPWENKIVIDF